MDYRYVYEEWLSNPYFDEATRRSFVGLQMMTKRSGTVLYRIGIRYGRASGNHRGWYQQNECIYSPQSDPGTGELHRLCGRQGEGRCHRL